MDKKNIFIFIVIVVTLFVTILVIKFTLIDDENLKDYEGVLLRQAKDGDVLAKYKLGLNYLDAKNGFPKDSKKGLEFLSQAAKEGNPRAQLYVGEMYQYGDTVPKNNEEAIKYYNLLLNNPQAANLKGVAYIDLGRIKSEGSSPQSKIEAFNYYTLSLNSGYKLAKLPLGLCYLEGTGVAKDTDKGIRLLEDAVIDNPQNKEVKKALDEYKNALSFKLIN